MFLVIRKVQFLIGLNVVLVLAVVGAIVYAIFFAGRGTTTVPTPDGATSVRTTQRKIETLALDDAPVDMDRLAESELAYVLTQAGQMAVVDTEQFRLDGQVQLLLPGQESLQVNNLRLSRLTPQAYVSTRRGQVLAVSTNSFQVEEQIMVGGRPTDVRVTPDGRYIFVLNESPPRVNVVELTSLEVIKSIPVGRGPVDLMMDAGGEFVYVANADAGSVSIISAINLSGVGSLLVGGRPVRVINYPGRDLVLILDQANSRVVTVNQRTNKVVGQMAVVEQPVDMVLDTLRNRLYVIGAGQKGVGVVDLEKEELIEIILLGSAFEKGDELKKIDLTRDSGKLVVLDEKQMYEVDVE